MLLYYIMQFIAYPWQFGNIKIKNSKEVYMSKNSVRTRFAPSPTGTMHVGNLRTALYEYLIAKSQSGSFILRIEDTDRERLVEGATRIIFNTLRSVGVLHDEGPNAGGDFGPYIQSERLGIYGPFAKQLVESGKAYYCFCSKERMETLKSSQETGKSFAGYDRYCRNISPQEINDNLKKGIPYVIRQKMPLTGNTTFSDMVFGEITVENIELEDQVLIKSDGFPTYNFANVIDDHLMNITHVVRGSEYLSSTPKYNLLYEAFGWDLPIYIHLPLIMGKNPDGSVSKLSKRHGSTSFDDLLNEGYLPEAIINYIALLGWAPKDNLEIMSMQEMISNFEIQRISKSPAIFDYDKLKWVNSEYIKKIPPSAFHELAVRYYPDFSGNPDLNTLKISELVQNRIATLTQIPEMVEFFAKLPEYTTDLFEHKKMKTTKEISLLHLESILPEIEEIEKWTHDFVHDLLINYAVKNEIKNGQIMWPIRTALSGLPSSPGGAVELVYILGKDETIKRIKKGISLLKE